MHLLHFHLTLTINNYPLLDMSRKQDAVVSKNCSQLKKKVSVTEQKIKAKNLSFFLKNEKKSSLKYYYCLKNIYILLTTNKQATSPRVGPYFSKIGFWDFWDPRKGQKYNIRKMKTSPDISLRTYF